MPRPSSGAIGTSASGSRSHASRLFRLRHSHGRAGGAGRRRGAVRRDQLEGRAGERGARHEVREVRRRAGDERDIDGIVETPHRVAGHTAAGREDLEPGGRGRSFRGGGRVVLLVCDPFVEVGGGQRDRADAHVGVREPAELGALTPVLTRVVGLERDARDATGHGVALAVERGDPERVDDVARADADLDRLPRGDDDLVGGDDALLGVAELPPPLLPDDVDHEGVVGCLGQVEHGGDGEHRDRHQEDTRKDRPGDLEPGVAVDLRRHLVGGVTLRREPPDDDADHRDHDDADDAGDDEHRDGEVVDRLGLGTLRIERVLRGILGAAREQQGAESERREDWEPHSPTGARRAGTTHGAHASRRHGGLRSDGLVHAGHA